MPPSAACNSHVPNLPTERASGMRCSRMNEVSQVFVWPFSNTPLPADVPSLPSDSQD